MERQAEKAAKYREYIKVKKNLEILIWYQRIKALREEQEGTEQSCRLQKALLDKITEKLEVLENETDKKYILTQKLNSDASSIQDKLKDITREQGEITAKISVQENDSIHFEKNVKEQTENLESAKKSLEELLPRQDVLLREYNDKTEEFKKFESLEFKIDDEANCLSGEIQKLYNQMSQKTSEIESLEKEISRNELLVKSKEGFETARRQQITEIEQRIENLKNQLKIINEENDEKRKLSEEIAESAKQYQKDLAESAETVETLREELEELNAVKQEKRLKLMELNQRHNTLLRMDRLLEGFSGSVKEIMRAAESNLIEGIHNPVSKILRTDEQYISAIETVLGGKMQNIVCRDDLSAKNAILYLKKTNLGRATFMPLNTVTGGTFIPINNVDRMQGYIGPASALCDYDIIYKNIVENLLGKIIVADNIDNATAIAKKLDFKVRVVTLDGQIINPGGSFTGGQVVSKSGILSRNRDIINISNEIKKVESDFNSVSKDVSEKEACLKSREDTLKVASRELSVINERIFGIENDLKIELNRARDIEENISVLNAGKNNISGTSRTIDDEIAEIQLNTDSLKDTLKTLKNEHQKLESGYKSLEEQLENNKKAKTDLFIERESYSGEIGRIKEKLNSLSVLINNLNNTLNSASSGLEAVKSAMEKSNREKENLIISLEELKSSEEVIKQEHQKILSDIDRVQKELFDLRALQKTQSSEKEEALQLYTSLQSKLDSNTAEKDSLISMLWEEYEFTYTDAEKYLVENNISGDRKEKNKELSEIKIQIKQLGSVNMEAVEQFEEEKKNYAFVKAQYDDIDNAKKELEKLISSMESVMREMFTTTFEQIRKNFKQTFAELFGGGYGEINLVDNGDILDCGIDINIQPPGKVIKSLSLLSGGEQAFVAIALYFAILNVNPAPFCVFDEIEAALDDTNVYRFGEYIKKYTDDTQFIVITHRRGTMEAADILYGVTMQEKGVTDFLKIDFNQLEMKGFKAE